MYVFASLCVSQCVCVCVATPVCMQVSNSRKNESGLFLFIQVAFQNISKQIELECPGCSDF